MSRNYVYAFPSVHGTCHVVNYRADSIDLSTFISNFDVWGSYGQFKTSNNPQYKEVWFECSKEFLEMLHTDTMKRTFKRMGVELVFEYPFMEEFEK